MTPARTAADIAALRTALDRGEPPGGPGLEVVRRGDGALDHVRVALATPLDVPELSRYFGEPAYPPRPPHGRRTVTFPQTGPRDGARVVTVLAELDASGRASVVVLRPDDLTV